MWVGKHLTREGRAGGGRRRVLPKKKVLDANQTRGITQSQWISIGKVPCYLDYTCKVPKVDVFLYSFRLQLPLVLLVNPPRRLRYLVGSMVLSDESGSPLTYCTSYCTLPIPIRVS